MLKREVLGPTVIRHTFSREVVTLFERVNPATVHGILDDPTGSRVVYVDGASGLGRHAMHHIERRRLDWPVFLYTMAMM